MIRFKGSGDKAKFSWSARIALLMLIPSLLLNAGAIYLVNRDTKAMVSWLRSPEPAPESVVRTLEREFDFRIASRLLVSAVLILFTMAILVLRRRHRSLQGTFEQFSLLALDIIESMTSGVIAHGDQLRRAPHPEARRQSLWSAPVAHLLGRASPGDAGRSDGRRRRLGTGPRVCRGSCRARGADPGGRPRPEGLPRAEDRRRHPAQR